MLRETKNIKKIEIMSWQQVVTLLPFFQSITKLEQSGSRIPDA